MIAFLLLAAAMLAAALFVVLRPLLRASTPASPDADLRRRLRALEDARDAGVIDSAEYAAKRQALGESALSAATLAPVSRTPQHIALAVALLLPLCAIMLYRAVGSPQALDPAARAPVAADAPAGHGDDMAAAITSLEEKLKADPKDAGGWALLGRAYRATNRFDDARNALSKARDLAPDDADVLVEYAEALALTHPRHSLAGEPRAAIDKALKIDPQNQHAMWLSGIADSQEKNYAAAIATWNRLLPLLPAGSDVVKSVQHQIAQAEALRDGRPPPDDAPADNAPPAQPGPGTAVAAAGAAETGAGAGATASASAATGPHLVVKVALAPALKDKVGPNDVLFVFAKAAAGPPMPLAIARLTAGQLPTTVTLTDGMGMMPQMTLSQFPQVIVGARVSKSGNAIAQAGDMQALTAPLPNSRTEPVTLTIDTIVP